jgi:hypothetical protein
MLLLAATLFPALWLVQMSLMTDVEAMRVPPTVFFVPTLDNYAAVFQGKFARSFVNSLVVSVLTTLTSMLLGVPAAYALSRASFGRSRGLALWGAVDTHGSSHRVRDSVLRPYRWLGLIDTVFGLLVIYLTFNLSLVMWMMRTFFDGIPRSLEEGGGHRRGGTTPGLCPRHPAPCRSPVWPPRRSSASCSPWNRLFSMPSSDAKSGPDGARGHRELHELRGLGDGAGSVRRRDHDHAARGGVCLGGAPVPDPRA